MECSYRNRGPGERGIGLVLALAAVTLLGLGALALHKLAPRASQFANESELRQAVDLAHTKLDELRTLPPLDRRIEAGFHMDPSGPIQGSFVRRWVVTRDEPIEGMRRVEMRVSFPTQNADSVAVVVTYF